jgi:hypothetical protein
MVRLLVSRPREEQGAPAEAGTPDVRPRGRLLRFSTDASGTNRRLESSGWFAEPVTRHPKLCLTPIDGMTCLLRCLSSNWWGKGLLRSGVKKVRSRKAAALVALSRLNVTVVLGVGRYSTNAWT